MVDFFPITPFQKTMLIGKGIVKSYGNLRVLKGIDIHIKKGEIVSIMGASGAGKSTLLHILGTLDSPDTGEIIINQKNIEKVRNNELAKFRNRHIGFIFQFHNLLPEFTTFENICIPGYIGNLEDKQVHKKAQELMKLLGISERQDHKPSQLSGGEQQRAAVARALINSPDIIFGDEPSGNLDSKNAEELHQLFLRLRNELGQTFAIVTHNSQLAQIADRILVIRDGKILNED